MVEIELERLLQDLESGHQNAAIYCARELLEAHRDDRARRIRELVREWVGRRGPARDTNNLFRQAAEEIDAIDTAEIPKKEG